jgi:hypothetical protein
MIGSSHFKWRYIFTKHVHCLKIINLYAGALEAEKQVLGVLFRAIS